MTQTCAELIAFLDRWQPRRIIVCGDFMLDQYIFGNAERLSPDAPVPVLATRRQEYRPGGAANVCLALRALHCEVICLGVIGDDDAGRTLKRRLTEEGCDVTGLVIDRDRPTTLKQNFIGLAQQRHAQKMFRVDTEVRTPLAGPAADELIDRADRLLADADVLCLEDYNKGVLSGDVAPRLIAAARRQGRPVLVDPASIDDYARYAGATAITPNRTEASRATGISAASGDRETIERLARILLDTLDLETVVLTLDKQGALLLERGSDPVLAPTVARSVYDVTGAGDIVLAMLAGAVANGAPWRQAVELANVAAGLEVERFGVEPIALEEVLLSVLDQHRELLGKQRTLEQLRTELRAHARQGRRIAFTNGCFDILHAGHVNFLREARKLGDLLVVGLNSDASIRRLKGADRPVNRMEDRVMVLSELQSVDYIIVFEDDTPMSLLEALRPHVLVKGGDYAKAQVVGGEFVETYGGEVAVVGLVEGRSTTNIIQRIHQNRAP